MDDFKPGDHVQFEGDEWNVVRVLSLGRLKLHNPRLGRTKIASSRKVTKL